MNIQLAPNNSMSHLDQQATRIPERYCMGYNSNKNDKYCVPSSWKMAQSILGKRSSADAINCSLNRNLMTMQLVI